MPVTAVIFMILYVTGLILTFRHPYFGIATYIFEWHNHPPYMWWGDHLPDLRWSFLVSVITLISLIINHRKLKPLHGASYKLIFWLVAFTLWMYFISAFYAVEPKESFRKAEIFYKLTIQIFLMMYIIREPRHFRFIIWVLLLGVANFGRIAFERGSNRYLGVIAPNSTEENAISAHVAAMLPFFGLYFLIGKNWEKVITLLSVPFLINLIILANSRATFVAVLVIGLLAVIWIKGKLRWRVVLALIGGAILVFSLSNEQFWERQSTIDEYHESGSRLHLWRGAIEMWKDHPMGLGGEGYQALVMDYVPELREIMEEKGTKTVHNTFLLVLVEWGFVGIILFFGLLIHTFVILGKIRRDRLKAPGYRYYVDAMAIQMGLIGILVAGIFHNRLYSEVIYWFSAFAVALRNIQVNEIYENAQLSEEV
ncbi:O-antigen ligase family protein [Calditrichota bacterium GD2]